MRVRRWEHAVHLGVQGILRLTRISSVDGHAGLVPPTPAYRVSATMRGFGHGLCFAVSRGLVAVLMIMGVTASWNVLVSSHAEASQSDLGWHAARLPSGFGLARGSFRAISCPTSTDCLAVGQHNGAMILRSTNEGISWHTASLPPGLGLFRTAARVLVLSCPTSTECFAAGYGKGSVILHTTDGGNTWQGTRLPSGFGLSNGYLDAISCPTSTECFAVGQGNYSGIMRPAVLIETTDGGISWHMASLPSYPGLSNGYLDAISCPTSTECLASGRGNIGYPRPAFLIETTDEGISWHTASLPSGLGLSNGSLRAIYCPTSTECFAVGYGKGSVVLRTTNGGNTWQGTSLPSGFGLSLGNLDAISCPTSSDCFAVGRGYTSNNTSPAVLIETTDGGNTWQGTRLPSGLGLSLGYLYTISCSTSTECLAVGYGKGSVVLRTTNGGDTWQGTSLPSGFGFSNSNLNAISCPTSTECFAVGRGTTTIITSPAVIIETTDGGNTWQGTSLPSGLGLSNGSLRAISCPTSTKCFTSGRGSVVLRTTNGGNTWQGTRLPSGLGLSGGNFDAISCPMSTECLAVGYGNEDLDAVLVKTTNGGNTWQVTRLPSGLGISGDKSDAISCPTSTECFAAGGDDTQESDNTNPAVLIETTDGGRSWHTASLPSGLGLGIGNLDAISCPTSTECFAAGQGSGYGYGFGYSYGYGYAALIRYGRTEAACMLGLVGSGAPLSSSASTSLFVKHTGLLVLLGGGMLLLIALTGLGLFTRHRYLKARSVLAMTGTGIEPEEGTATYPSEVAVIPEAGHLPEDTPMPENTLLCPACNAHNPSANRFCGVCGSEIDAGHAPLGSP